jgi:Ni,Fe-hydrogenase III large subunit
VAVSDIPLLAADAWRGELLARLKADSRLITLYGQKQSDGVTLTAVTLGPARELDLSRTVVRPETGYHELTSELPALHCFERELVEQTGLHVAGHPWLKPIRYEGQGPSAMASYPFYRVEGKEVHEVAVGPIHAGVIEPGSFRFSCLGELVLHLEIQLGYQHRGVERRLLECEPRRLAPLVETVAGDTSIGHSWAYCAAIECLAGFEPGLDVDFGRALMLEFERVAMHLASLAGLSQDIGLLQGATTYGRLRTTAINTMMRLCGSRFGKGALRPGGVRMQLTPELAREVSASTDLLRDDLEPINQLFLSARMVQHRLRGVGTLTTAKANELGMVGLAARASGLRLDMRALAREGAYQLLRIHPCVLMDGDCWSRARLRIDELGASLSWIAAVLQHYADWQQPLGAVGALAPGRLAIAVVEGFRGEVVHCLETDAQGRLCHYKVQDPSLRNWIGLAMAVRGNEISDFPVCNKSFDLSYAGHDL